MSYIEYDPTNPADFNNFVSKQEKRKRLIKFVVFAGLTAIVLYLVYKENVKKKDDEFEVL